MKKVYLVIAIYKNVELNEAYTRIAHVCNDKDLAVEYANKYVIDDIHAFLKDSKNKKVVCADVKEGKYLSEDDLFDNEDEGIAYITAFVDDDISKGVKEEFSILIEAHEVRED